MTLTSGGAITDGDGATTVDIVGGAATLVAATTVGATGDAAIDLSVTSLRTTTSGAQHLNAIGAVALDVLNAGAGSITLTSAGEIIDANNDLTNNVTASTLNIAGNQAVTSIETAVSNLGLTTGAASITNTGALAVLDSTLTGQLDLVLSLIHI